MVAVPIATGFYVDPTRSIAAQECTNWRPQFPQTNAQTDAQLVHTAGTEQFATAGDNPARGEYQFQNIAYTVHGDKLNRINEDQSVTELGTIAGSGKVSIADNGIEMCIVVPGEVAYIYDTTNGLVQITDSNFVSTLGPSQQVVHHDGYFVHFNNNAPASSKPIFFISNLNQGGVFSALDFGTAEVDPDEITALHVNRNRLYVAGRETVEPFANIGGSGFPYQRIRGAVVQKGCEAKFTFKDFNNSFLWIGAGEGQRVSVWQFDAGSARRVSNDSVDFILQGFSQSEIESSFATVYAGRGHFVYYIHLSDRTLGYDSSTQLWHERKSKNPNGLLTSWRVNGIFSVYGRILVTDNQDGKVGEMRDDIYTEYGESVQRIVTTAPIKLDDVTLSQVDLNCETGTANASGAGSDPVVSMEVSNDNGYTFGNKTSRSLGKQGNRTIKQVWRRQGQISTSARVWRFTIDEPIKASILGLDIR